MKVVRVYSGPVSYTHLFHVVRVEIRPAELPVGQAVRQLASIVEEGSDVGDGAAAEFDARDVGLVHAQHHVGVLAARVALGGRAVDVAGQGQVVADLPLGIGAVQVGVDHPVLGHVEQFRICLLYTSRCV